MTQSNSVLVTGRDGLRGTVAGPVARDGAGGATVDVRLEDGRHVRVPATMLVVRDDGSYELPLSAADLGGSVGTSAGEVREGQLVIPVMAEHLRVDKRVVESGRVRIRKTVGKREKVVEGSLAYEEVVVERRPVNREVDGPVSVRQTRKAIIVPILQEVLVVQKKLMLREELVITKRRTVRPARQVVTLRHDEVEIERVGTADGTAGREREPDRAPAPRPGAVEGGGTDPAADRGGRGRRGAGKSKR